MSNRKKQELLQELAREGYELFGPQSAPGANEEDGAAEDATDLGKGYDYLLSMKIWSLTLEKVRGWFGLGVVGCVLNLAHLSACLVHPKNTISQHTYHLKHKCVTQVEALRAELAEKEAELEELRRLTAADLWLRDLDNLVRAQSDIEGCFWIGVRAWARLVVCSIDPDAPLLPLHAHEMITWQEEKLEEYADALHIVPACEVAAGRGGGRGGKKAKKGECV